MYQMILLIILGFLVGIISGALGIGGAVILIPSLVFLFGMSQQMAQGTTLAMMVPPIGIMAAYTYYKNGYVDLKIALLMCIGFVIGGWVGAKIAVMLPAKILKKMFAIFLLLIGAKMFFNK